MRKFFVAGIAVLVTAPGLVLAAVTPAHAATLDVCNTTKTLLQNQTIPWVSNSRHSTSGCRLYETTSPTNSSAVRALQRSLKTCYNKTVTIDGWFGSETRRALIAVQGQIGVHVDGWYGPETKKNMRHAPSCAYAR